MIGATPRRATLSARVEALEGVITQLSQALEEQINLNEQLTSTKSMQEEQEEKKRHRCGFNLYYLPNRPILLPWTTLLTFVMFAASYYLLFFVPSGLDSSMVQMAKAKAQVATKFADTSSSKLQAVLLHAYSLVVSFLFAEQVTEIDLPGVGPVITCMQDNRIILAVFMIGLSIGIWITSIQILVPSSCTSPVVTIKSIEAENEIDEDIQETTGWVHTLIDEEDELDAQLNSMLQNTLIPTTNVDMDDNDDEDSSDYSDVDIDVEVEVIKVHVTEHKHTQHQNISNDMSQELPQHQEQEQEQEQQQQKHQAKEVEHDDEVLSIEGQTPEEEVLNAVDDLHEDHRYEDAHNLIVNTLISAFPTSAELYWRLAKSCYHSAKEFGRDGKLDLQRQSIEQGLVAADKAVELNPESPYTNKWKALCAIALGDISSKKTRLEQAFIFQKHTKIALNIKSDDADLYHMYGRFCFEIANINWATKRLATIVFGELPQVTIEESIQNFEAAHVLEPEWILNLVWIGKVQMKLNNNELAKSFFNQALSLSPERFEDEEAQLLAQTLLKSL